MPDEGNVSELCRAPKEGSVDGVYTVLQYSMFNVSRSSNGLDSLQMRPSLWDPCDMRSEVANPKRFLHLRLYGNRHVVYYVLINQRQIIYGKSNDLTLINIQLHIVTETPPYHHVGAGPSRKALNRPNEEGDHNADHFRMSRTKILNNIRPRAELWGTHNVANSSLKIGGKNYQKLVTEPKGLETANEQDVGDPVKGIGKIDRDRVHLSSFRKSIVNNV
ncbi:hypothetical protein J6590_037041 [Homalodisca vitripennis]|nr:hypothetical protein J6590_037041 [Homalodisca vitripennis]